MQRPRQQENKSLFPVPMALKTNFSALSQEPQTLSPLQRPTKSTDKQTLSLSPIKLPKPVEVTPSGGKTASFAMSPLSKPQSACQENFPPQNTISTKKECTTIEKKRNIAAKVGGTRSIDPALLDQAQQAVKEKDLRISKLTARLSESETSMELMKKELQRKKEEIAQLQEQLAKQQEKEEAEKIAAQADHLEKIQWKDHHITGLNQQIEELSVQNHKHKIKEDKLAQSNEELKEQYFSSLALSLKLTFASSAKHKPCSFCIRSLWNEVQSLDLEPVGYPHWLAERIEYLYRTKDL